MKIIRTNMNFPRRGKVILYLMRAFIGLFCMMVNATNEIQIPEKKDVQQKQDKPRIQQLRVSGTVTGPDSASLPDVSIIVKGTDRRITSNLDGKYNITVQDRDTLIFSFAGFKMVEEAIDGRSTINVQMKEVNAGSQEGEKSLSKKELRRLKRAEKKELRRLKREEKNKIPDNVNSWEDLGGYMPGVIIERRGANYDVQVRGVNSISSMGQTGGQNSNRPLYIIDGVPCQNSLDQCGLHPSQVKNMEVLKGEETSFYGSKGGNGVVVITTKNNSKTN